MESRRNLPTNAGSSRADAIVRTMRTRLWEFTFDSPPSRHAQFKHDEKQYHRAIYVAQFDLALIVRMSNGRRHLRYHVFITSGSLPYRSTKCPQTNAASPIACSATPSFQRRRFCLRSGDQGVLQADKRGPQTNDLSFSIFDSPSKTFFCGAVLMPT